MGARAPPPAWAEAGGAEETKSQMPETGGRKSGRRVETRTILQEARSGFLIWDFGFGIGC